MYWCGCPNYCNHGNDSNNWIWIIIVIFVLFYIFRDNNGRDYR